ncbi:MAG TPA: hypothetical protein GYA08_19920 [Chloroflexi bacterium]|nr:hypothetical protein [Chloroflexota bacterium]
MRICLIAPMTSDLAIPGEIQEVANTFSEAGHMVRITPASRQGLRDAMYAGTFEMVWFAGHGGDEGFGLADGVWRPVDCGRWLAAVGAWSFVANACFSAEHVQTIQQIADVDIVATIAPAGVEDDTAADTALYLARALVETNSLAQATQRASAGGQLQYRYFPSGRMNSSAQRAAEEQEHQDVAALVKVFRGDPITGQPGLVATLNTLASKLDTLATAFDAYRASTEARLDALEKAQRTGGQVQMSPRVASLLMFLSVMMIVLMFWVIVRLGGA